MPTYKGTVSLTTTYTVVADDVDKAAEFILDNIEADTDSEFFDSYKVTNIEEIN